MGINDGCIIFNWAIKHTAITQLYQLWLRVTVWVPGVWLIPMTYRVYSTQKETSKILGIDVTIHPPIHPCLYIYLVHWPTHHWVALLQHLKNMSRPSENFPSGCRRFWVSSRAKKCNLEINQPKTTVEVIIMTSLPLQMVSIVGISQRILSQVGEFHWIIIIIITIHYDSHFPRIACKNDRTWGWSSRQTDIYCPHFGVHRCWATIGLDIGIRFICLDFDVQVTEE